MTALQQREAQGQRTRLGLLADFVLLTGLGLTLFFILTAPDPVPLRFNLAGAAVLGSRWRALLWPALLLLVSGIMRQAEASGTINTPSPVSLTERQKIAAGVRIFALALLLLPLVGSLVSPAWPASQAALGLLLGAGLAACLLLGRRMAGR